VKKKNTGLKKRTVSLANTQKKFFASVRAQTKKLAGQKINITLSQKYLKKSSKVRKKKGRKISVPHPVWYSKALTSGKKFPVRLKRKLKASVKQSSYLYQIFKKFAKPVKKKN